jgi:hypothetical protein
VEGINLKCEAAGTIEFNLINGQWQINYINGPEQTISLNKREISVKVQIPN